MDKNIVLDKSFDFSVRVVNLYKYLCKEKKEYVLSKQLLSKNDFIAKMAIASKEARESKYWIDLLVKTDYLNASSKHTKSLKNEIEEIIKLLTSIVKTSQNSK